MRRVMPTGKITRPMTKKQDRIGRGEGAAKVLIRSSSVRPRVAAKATLGPNICESSSLISLIQQALIMSESYRHQLNHEPKHIYKCTHPGCTREFVRQDLRNRHMDRHTAKGSALSRKDSMTMSSLPSGSISPETNRSGGFPKPGGPGASPYTPISATPPVYPHGNPPHGLDNYMQSDNSYGNNMSQRHPHQSPSGGSRPALQTNVGPYGVLSPGSTQHGSYQSQPINTPQSTPTGPYVGQNNFPPFTLPPSDFSTASSSGAPGDASQSYTPATNGEYTDPSHAQASGEMMLLDQMASQTTIPVFGPDGGLNKSPYITIPEDFITYLFNTNNPDGSPSVGHVMAPGQYSQ